MKGASSVEFHGVRERVRLLCVVVVDQKDPQELNYWCMSDGQTLLTATLQVKEIPNLLFSFIPRVCNFYRDRVSCILNGLWRPPHMRRRFFHNPVIWTYRRHLIASTFPPWFRLVMSLLTSLQSLHLDLISVRGMDQQLRPMSHNCTPLHFPRKLELFLATYCATLHEIGLFSTFWTWSSWIISNTRMEGCCLKLDDDVTAKIMIPVFWQPQQNTKW